MHTLCATSETHARQTPRRASRGKHHDRPFVLIGPRRGFAKKEGLRRNWMKVGRALRVGSATSSMVARTMAVARVVSGGVTKVRRAMELEHFRSNSAHGLRQPTQSLPSESNQLMTEPSTNSKVELTMGPSDASKVSRTMPFELQRPSR